MSFFNYHGYKIEQQRIGNHLLGKSNVIFLHGFNDPFQNHMNILDGMAEQEINLWAINFPGHGNSEEMQDITWDRLVDILNAFISERNLADVILVGYSMGGGIALKALEFQLDITAVVLISPFCFQFDFTDLSGSVKSFDLVKDLLGILRPPHKMNRSKPRPWDANPTYLLENYIKIFLAFDLSLEDNHVPIEVILLKDDQQIRPEKVKEALQKVKNVKYKEIKDLGHVIYYLSDAKIAQITDNINTLITKHAQIQKSFWSKLFKK